MPKDHGKARHAVLPRTLCLVFDSAARDAVLVIEWGAAKGKLAGRCNFLGGHVEKGEDVLASAVREASEESGLPEAALRPGARLEGVVHVEDFFGAQVMMFVATMELSPTTRALAAHSMLAAHPPSAEARFESHEGVVHHIYKHSCTATVQAFPKDSFRRTQLVDIRQARMSSAANYVLETGSAGLRARD